VKGTVTVEEGALLTIQKDVNVYLVKNTDGDKGKLVIEGNITANGENSSEAIYFGPETAGSDGSWGIELYQIDQVTLFNYVSCVECFYGIRVSQSDVHISNSTFQLCTYGIFISRCDSAVVTDSNFQENDKGVEIELSQGHDLNSIQIKRNSFDQCNECTKVTFESYGTIKENSYTNSEYAVICRNGSIWNVHNNTFQHCSFGCYFIQGGHGQIEYNHFSENGISIYMNNAMDVFIHYNNLLAYNEYSLKVIQNDASYITDAENNWWNTTVKEEIDISIWDGNDVVGGSAFGLVDYEPYETAVIESAGR